MIPRFKARGGRCSFLAARVVGTLLLIAAAGGPPAFAQCVPANCDDGNPCTGDACFMGTCSHFLTFCDDSNQCTTDACNPATGGCTHTPIICGDNDVCTSDFCDQQLGCLHFPVACQNPSACTTARCEPTTGCVVESICDDGDACTDDACDTATDTCVFTPFGCYDGNACTYDVCDPAVGCRFPRNPRCFVVSPLAVKTRGTQSTMSYKRKGGATSAGPFVKITLQDTVIVSRDQKLVPLKVTLKVILTGDDAGIASLLYPVVALGAGAGALDTLRARGYDVSVTGDVPSCQSQFPPQTCSALALQLSKAIDSTLALGDAAERDAFRQGAQALGYPPDNCGTP